MARRMELGVAAACTAWAAAFLAGEGAALAFAPLLGLAVLPLRRHPAGAVLAVAAVTLAMYLSGVSEENPAALAAGLTVTYALGRHARGTASLALVALGLALTIVGGLAVADAVFVAFVLAATWTCGHLVRRSTERARRAATAAAELAARDPAVLAAQVVAEERARLAGDALAVIRRAVETMHRDAVVAEPDLGLRPLLAIQEGGRAAVAELRRLLGLLRSEPEPAPAERRPGPPEADKGDTRRRLPAEALVAAGLIAVCLADVAAWESGAASGSIALTLAFAATTALVRVDAAAACLVAALPSALALALDVPLVYGFSTALASGVLAWSACEDARPLALLALGVLLAVTLVVVNADSPGNEAILLGAFVLPGLAGRAWGQRGREGQAATAVAARLRFEHEATTERAVRAERLRLARELHDVASHAVGAMVLQAGAALALRERDPDAARAAVRSVQAAGAEAMGELSVLFGLLDAGTVGPAGLAAAHADGDAAGALDALAGRMRAGGLDVSISAPASLPDDPVVLAIAYRIVQEGLTNAARHAPGSRVEVMLATTGGSLAVTVRDDGAGPARDGAAPEGGGFGLVGLAERVRSLGGEVAAGPAAGGGFTVTARLPVAEQAGAPA